MFYPARICCLLIGITFLLAPVARAATPEQIDDAISRAKTFIYAKQNPDGLWEIAPADDAKQNNKVSEGGQWGGRTAIAVYALLAAGESPQNPKLAKAIDFLTKSDIGGTYAVGLRAQVWQYLPQTNQVLQLARRDAFYLLNSVKTKGNALGHYGYYPIQNDYSHSRSQYGVLGVWTAALLGVEIPPRYWQVVEQGWLNNQDPSGGWTYQHPKDTKHAVTPGMTAAAVASLYVVQDYLYGNRGLDCKSSADLPSDKSIAAGLKWLENNFDKVASDKRYDRDFPLVTLYAIERVGVASGRKYFGTHDWYEKGSGWLLKNQQKDGSFKVFESVVADLPGTCFATLFLARGGAPILMNKLEYGEGGKSNDWNNRPRDVANVARWVGRQSEREFNWQVVNLQAKPADWHDAPILYISGNDALALSPDDQQKIKHYIEQGGLILANADCGSRQFAASVRKMGEELFPGQEFRILPDDHPIYTARFPRDRWRSKPQVLGLSNGVRELIVLIASGDPARDWQTMQTGGKESSWELAANLYQYAVEGTAKRSRGMSHWIAKDNSIKSSQTITVARLQTEGNWNPEPGGWDRLAAYLNNRYKINLQTKPVKIAELPADLKVAHLTGTTDLKLTPEDVAGLKKFIDAGGTLLIDAAGGSAPFATAAEKIIADLFPGKELELIPEDAPLYQTAAENQIPIAYRAHTRKALGTMPKGPRLKGIKSGDRYALIYSREDLSAGLVGQEVDGIAGYTPDAATRLMTQILLTTTKTKAELVKPDIKKSKG